jgi:hypothetical protein
MKSRSIAGVAVAEAFVAVTEADTVTEPVTLFGLGIGAASEFGIEGVTGAVTAGCVAPTVVRLRT